MNSRQLTANVTGNVNALRTLPQRPMLESPGDLERSPTDPGEIEYQSWLQHLRRGTADAGEIEYASWSQHLRASRQ